MSMLVQAERNYKKGIIKPSTKIIVLHNLSLLRTQKADAHADEIKKAKDQGPGPTIIILPAKMSDMEKETTAAMLGV